MCQIKQYFLFFLSLISMLILSFGIPIFIFSQTNPCDQNLHPRPTDPLGYRLRNDRCEGRYIQDVSSTMLLLASFTESFEDYDFNGLQHLVVEWTTIGDENIHLRAQGIRRRLYYRMDAICPARSNNYRWPIDILSALESSRRDIGVVGRTRYTLNGIEKELYVPLRIWQRAQPLSSREYRVVLLTGNRLSEVSLTLALLGPDGGPVSFIIDGEKLGYGYYPAEHAICFTISNLNESGIYLLEIGAALINGGSSVLEIWFYHRGWKAPLELEMIKSEPCDE